VGTPDGVVVKLKDLTTREETTVPMETIV
jgi:hypothetical protein